LLITLTVLQPTGLAGSTVTAVADAGIGFTCGVTTAYDSVTGEEIWTCETSLAGYIGALWDAVLTPSISGGYELCASPASGAGVIDTAAGTITFANQSVGTTTQPQSITIADSAVGCP
jgi:hypothetical protein